MAERVVIESMVEQTREILRERIRSGELPPGTRLRQEKLAEDLGISRTPLREALRLLAADGLVELQLNRGAVVSTLSHADRVAFHRWLQHQLDASGSIVAKQPDVWGQSRLTRHRVQYEAQMERQLGMFTVVLLLVSAVIVALIVYTLTMDKLREIARTFVQG